MTPPTPICCGSTRSHTHGRIVAYRAPCVGALSLGGVPADRWTPSSTRPSLQVASLHGWVGSGGLRGVIGQPRRPLPPAMASFLGRVAVGVGCGVCGRCRPLSPRGTSLPAGPASTPPWTCVSGTSFGGCDCHCHCRWCCRCLCPCVTVCHLLSDPPGATSGGWVRVRLSGSGPRL